MLASSRSRLQGLCLPTGKASPLLLCIRPVPLSGTTTPLNVQATLHTAACCIPGTAMAFPCSRTVNGCAPVWHPCLPMCRPHFKQQHVPYQAQQRLSPAPVQSTAVPLFGTPMPLRVQATLHTAACCLPGTARAPPLAPQCPSLMTQCMC